MKFQYFLKDKKFFIISFLILWFLILLLLFAYKVSVELIIAFSLLLFIFAILVILIEYFKKKKFYNALITITANLDKKYLVTEMLTTPDFLEGKILYNTLYEIDKSMLEHIKTYEENIQDFKEYIEMWIHEVKIHLSSLVLMVHNNQKLLSGKITKTIQRLDNYVEQVLYYIRLENSEHDYLLKKCNLGKIVHKVIKRNQDSLLFHKISIEIKNINEIVISDSKWLEFIINQIISNSNSFIH